MYFVDLVIQALLEEKSSLLNKMERSLTFYSLQMLEGLMLIISGRKVSEWDILMPGCPT